MRVRCGSDSDRAVGKLAVFVGTRIFEKVSQGKTGLEDAGDVERIMVSGGGSAYAEKPRVGGVGGLHEEEGNRRENG